MQLPSLNDGQIVVALGDALFSFDSSKIVFNDSRVTGLAYPGPVEIAFNHVVNHSVYHYEKFLNP